MYGVPGTPRNSFAPSTIVPTGPWVTPQVIDKMLPNPYVWVQVHIQKCVPILGPWYSPGIFVGWVDQSATWSVCTGVAKNQTVPLIDTIGGMTSDQQEAVIFLCAEKALAGN
jgi:hypothetical protein